MPVKKIKITEPVEEQLASPPWGDNAKLVISLTIIAFVVFLLWRFSSLITPLMMVFIIAYLLHPVTALVVRILHVSWGAAVTIIYALTIVLLLGLILWGGVGLLQQVQSLVTSVQDIISNLPAYIQSLTSQAYHPFGLFTVDLTHLDLNVLSGDLISNIEPVLGRTGNVIGVLAGSIAESVSSILLVFLISYFVMVESSGVRSDLIKISIPGYEHDFYRLNREISHIWNAFLRGQLLISALTAGMYAIILPLFGVSYALGIAIMAGLSKFLPYFGPFITWTVLVLVTFFQPDKAFGLHPIPYTLIVLGIMIVGDQIIDNFIAPRIMAHALKVHPAAVLVAVLIAASFFGLLGVVIAAPLLATCTLFGRYAMRKMFDMDPWPESDSSEEARPLLNANTQFQRVLSGLGLKSKNK